MTDVTASILYDSSHSATFTLLGGKLQMLDTQPRPSEDPLWLTAFVPPLPAGSRVLDAGCGSGAAALSLLIRQPHVYLEAIDIAAHLTERALANAHINNLSLIVHTADILQSPAIGPYDAIICNPPYHAEERGHSTPDSDKATAHTLPEGDLTRWLTNLTHMLAPQGSLHLILHSACEAELTAFAQSHHFLLHLTPLQTAEAKPAKRVLALLEKHPEGGLHRHPAIPAFNPDVRKQHLG